MKINISAIKNENTLTEVKAATANEVTGGETTGQVSWNSQTKGPTSGQILDVEEFYVLPGATNFKFKWAGWS